jgi:gliding motility-associated-like protein
MIKRLLNRFFSSALALCLFTLTVKAQLPYGESFRNSTAPGIQFGGIPTPAFLTAGPPPASLSSPPVRDPEGDGYLRLTSNSNDQKGYIFSEASFPGQKGLRIEVEYFVYQGTGGTYGADGICFFLFDGSVPSDQFRIGGFGGSLGYAPKLENGNPVAGMSKGYIGVGLDEYGNFSNNDEGRYGGDVGAVLKPGSVTVRGKGDGDPFTTNYPFLATAQTNTVQFPFTLVPNGPGNAVRVTNQNDPFYRKAMIIMEPVGSNPVTGYKITAKILVGGPTPTTYTLIDEQVYNEPPPALLKYGISASTGFATNFHEIRNVDIRVFNPATLVLPTAGDDLINSCVNRPTVITPLTNDATANEGATLVPRFIDLDPAVSGRQHTFSVSGKGTFTADDEGNVTWTPLNSSITGPVSVSYTITDLYTQESLPATITINDVAPPAIDAGADQQLTVTAVPSPNNTANLSATIGGGVTGSWTQIAGATSVTFDHPNSAATGLSGMSYGLYTFRFTGRTGSSCDGQDDVNVFVNAIPVAANDVIATSTSTTVQIPVLTNDVDANGNSTVNRTTVAIVQAPTHGTAVIDPVTGIINYTPAAGFSGDDSFLYTVKDNFGVVSNQGLVTISVSIKPAGADDMITTTCNAPVASNVRTNDGTQAGTVTVIKKTDPLHGIVNITTGGTATYMPTTDYHGIDMFTYVLRNQYGLDSDPITVNVTVRPSGEDDIVTTVTNTPVQIPVKDNDPGKTGSTVTRKSDPVHGSIVIGPTGIITYSPAADYQGSDSFTYSLIDGDALESNAITVSVIIKPSGTNDVLSTDINTPVIIAVKDNDASKTGTTVIKKTDPAHGSVVVNADGTVTYMPAVDFQGDDSFTYALRNTNAIESDPVTVTITVKPKLSTTNDAAITNLNTPLIVAVKDNDASASGSTVIKQTNPAHGAVTVNTDGTITYVPNTNYYGMDSFTYILKAGTVESDPTTVTIGVRPAGVNDAYTTLFNTEIVASVKDNDVSKTGTTVSKQSEPLHGTATVNADGTITYVPVNNYTGIDEMTYILSTSDPLNSHPVTVRFSIKPAGSDDIATGMMNAPVPIPVKDNDISKNATSPVRKTNPVNGTATVNIDGTISYTPDANFHGKDTFTYSLRTPDGVESDPITVVVNIKPSGTNDIAAAGVGTPAVIRVKDNDPAKNGSSVIKRTDPTHGTVVVNPDGTVLYTPVAGYRGTDMFMYTLRNADGLESEPVTVAIDVRNIPVAGPDIIPSVEGQPITFDVLTNDTGEGPLDKSSLEITTPPQHGTLTIDPLTGKITYTPFPGYSGSDSFAYTVKDDQGVESQPATVTIEITSPKIGLAKQLVEAKPAINGSYNVKYLFTIVNYSSFPLYNISLIDDLVSQFKGTSISMVKLSHQGSLTLNPNFNGDTDIEMLDITNSTLPAGDEEQVELSFNVKLVSKDGIFRNSAIVKGGASGGATVSDQSTDGSKPDPETVGDVSPNVETDVELKINPVFIPEGFSPNGDGKNDVFVIQNTLDKPVSLEIYNRWNNMVYRSADYQNDWDGKTTMGVHVGDYVPSGTYWYIVVVDGAKYNGFITINR